MYIHVELNSSTSTSDAEKIWTCIKDLLDVNSGKNQFSDFTSSALGPIDAAASYVVGTRPTAGIYSMSSYTTGSWAITKKHYDYANKPSGFGSNDMGVKMYLYWSSASGFYTQLNDIAGGNTMANASQATQAGASIEVGYSNFSNVISLDFCFTDVSFTMAGHGNPNNTVNQQPCFIQHYGDYPTISDYDYQALLDNYRYNAGCYFTCGSYGIQTNANVNGSYSLYRPQMRTQTGVFGNALQTDGGYHLGWASSSYSSNYPGYLYMEPNGRSPVWETATAAGNATMLHPLYISPGFHQWQTSQQSQHDTRYGQMMGLYRIADNIGTAHNGNRLQVGSQYYRILKGHPTAASTTSSGPRIACYAVPEHNITGP